MRPEKILKRTAVISLSLIIMFTLCFGSFSVYAGDTAELTAEDTIEHYSISIVNDDFISYGDVSLGDYNLGDEVQFRINIWPASTGETKKINVYFYVEGLSDLTSVIDVKWSSDGTSWKKIKSFEGKSVKVEDAKITYWISLKFQAEGDYRMVAYATDSSGELSISSNYRYIKIADGEQITKYSNSEIVSMGYSLYLESPLPHETDTDLISGGSSTGVVSSGESSVSLKRPVIKKIKARKKSITVKWKKVKNATGYKVRLSTKKNFKKSKIATVKKSVNRGTVKKLKRGKKYYIKVQAYMKSGTKVVCSRWSKRKKAKTK